MEKTIREIYAYQEKNKKTYYDLKKYWKYEIPFEISGKECIILLGKTKTCMKEDNNKFELPDDVRNKISTERVWALFGSNDNSTWECLQVAQTKSRIILEINDAITYIVHKKKCDNPEKSMNTTFYKNVYNLEDDKSDKREYSYGIMGTSYSKFQICILNVDEYLGINDSKNKDLSEDMKNMINISKYLYAEAKLAYETLSYHWNMYNPGVDGQAIMLFLERDNPKGV